MAKAKTQEHKSKIGEILWTQPILKDLRGNKEFASVWRGLRVAAMIFALGLINLNFGFIPEPWFTIVNTSLAPAFEKELRGRAPSWFDF